MERFFPKERIVLTGNPVRQSLQDISCTREEAITFFGLDPKKKTVLVVGGSLGARTINQSVISALDRIPGDEVQLIWQSGKYYEESVKAALAGKDYDYVVQMPFITRMDMAYKAADLVISRAGAGSISELCLLGKPALLVPSPNVAEDHQTKNGRLCLSPIARLLPVSSIRRWTLYGTMFCLKKCSSVFFRWRNVIRRPVSPILFLKS